MRLTALDIALLPPRDVHELAIALSSRLPREESLGLRLGEDCLPHVTLAQLFVRDEDLASVHESVDDVLRDQPALILRVTGGGRGSSSVWMEIERTPALVRLHERLMERLSDFERAGGTANAFLNGDARPGDIAWVHGYRAQSSFDAFTPHITLGHAATVPSVEPFEFEASVAAACHLGRFCTCRRRLRSWTLAGVTRAFTA